MASPELRRPNVNWRELALPALLIGVWILLQLVVFPRMGVST